MHHIQRRILERLILATTLHFSELKPKDMESNLFMYHLKQLMNQKLVQKHQEGGYSLTAEGRAYADRLSFSNLQPRQQPKIVIILALKNSTGQTLLYRRNHQPYFGSVGYPSGKTHLGELIGQAAKRELLEKTGLSTTLRHVGDVYIKIAEGEQLISHVLGHVFSGVVDGEPKNLSKKGESFWGKPNDFQANIMPGFFELERLITDSKEHFFTELAYDIS